MLCNMVEIVGEEKTCVEGNFKEIMQFLDRPTYHTWSEEVNKGIEN